MLPFVVIALVILGLAAYMVWPRKIPICAFCHQDEYRLEADGEEMYWMWINGNMYPYWCTRYVRIYHKCAGNWQ